MRRTRPHRLVALALLAVLISALVAPEAHANENGGNQCGSPGDRWGLSISKNDCAGGAGSGAQGGPGRQHGDSQTGQPHAPTKNGSGDKGSLDYQPALKNWQPTDAPGQWAKATVRGVQGQAYELQKRVNEGSGKVKFSGEWVTLYSVMFALGWVIAVVAAMIATTQIARRREVNGMLVARHAFTRLVLFTPICAFGPMLLGVMSDLAGGLASGFLGMARAELNSELGMIIDILGAATGISVLVPGGSAVAVGLFGLLMLALLGILVELLVAKFLVFMLALLAPILVAASINPAWTGGLRKVIGGLVAAFLAPAALYFTWAVAAATISGAGLGTGAFTRICVFFVAMAVALVAPVGVGMVLSYVVPGFAASAGGLAHGRGALSGVGRSAQARLGGFGRQGSDRAKRATQAPQMLESAQQSPTAPPAGGGSGPAGRTGVGTGGAASGGGVGAALAAWAAIAKGTLRGGRAASERLANAAANSDHHAGGGGGAGGGKPGGTGSNGSGRTRRPGRGRPAEGADSGPARGGRGQRGRHAR